MSELDPDLLAWLKSQYLDVRVLPDGSIAALCELITTRSIILGVTRDSWESRFCFRDRTLASVRFAELQTEDDVPAGFIARRPQLTEDLQRQVDEAKAERRKPLMGDQAKGVFGDLKTEARLNTARIDPAAVELNANVMRLFVRPGLDALAKDGEPDTRCGTCAYRPGTVPAGCVVTQMDALKAIHTDTPFFCHSHMDERGEPDTICHGWYAARSIMEGKTLPAPWPWGCEVMEPK